MPTDKGRRSNILAMVNQARAKSLHKQEYLSSRLPLPSQLPAVMKRRKKQKIKEGLEDLPKDPVRKSARLRNEKPDVSTTSAKEIEKSSTLASTPYAMRERMEDEYLPLEPLGGEEYQPFDFKDDGAVEASSLDWMRSMGKMKLVGDGIKLVKARGFSIAWHPTSWLLAVGDKEGEVSLAEFPAQQILDEEEAIITHFSFRPHVRPVCRLQFVDRGSSLLSTSYDGTVRRVELAEGRESSGFQLVSLSQDKTDGVWTTHSHSPCSSTAPILYLTNSRGNMDCVDMRSRKEVWSFRTVHRAKINTVHTGGDNDGLIAFSSLDKTASIWDIRSMKRSLVSLTHPKSVNSAWFAPRGSTMLATTCLDNRIYVFRQNMLLSAHKRAKEWRSSSLPHNNHTGRWLTRFQAVWDPKLESEKEAVLLCGSMEKPPHGIDVIKVQKKSSSTSVGIRVVSRLEDEAMQSVQSLVEAHPTKMAFAGVNSSGRCHVFRC